MKTPLADKNVLVVGLSAPGKAACALLLANGARVYAVDEAPAQQALLDLEALSRQGVQAGWGENSLPARLDLAVVSPEILPASPILRALELRGVPLIGELELGFQLSGCLNLTVAGTNGKTTTARLIEQILVSNHRPVLRCGTPDLPLCSVVGQSRDMDYLLVEVSAGQLERVEFFRPAVAVLTNLVSDFSFGSKSPAEQARTVGRLFANQQVHDWAIIQSGALRLLKESGVALPGKTISYSATDSQADLYLDRGLVISRLPNWSGPLLDLGQCSAPGPHNAENIMAGLAVGHVLRLPLESMLDAVKAFEPGPHCVELIAEINGVKFINDAKAGNPGAAQQGVLAWPRESSSEPNVWLIAGGIDKGEDFHDLGPILSKRLKGAFVFDTAAPRMRASWSLFTPCTLVHSLLEAVHEAAKNAASGDVVLLSPSCSSFTEFRNHEQCGEAFCIAVKSIDRGAKSEHPNIHGKNEQT